MDYPSKFNSECRRFKARCWAPMLAPAIVGLLLASQLGCAENHPYELAQVRGTVTLNGKRLANTSTEKFKVMFAPVAKQGTNKAGKPGFGQLNDDGTYTLSTYGADDGAVVGTHWVTIIRTQPPPETHQTPTSLQNSIACDYLRSRWSSLGTKT